MCSFALTGKAFSNIPNELKNKTTFEVIKTFFTPPVGALIAAMISTFGIYFVASFLYVRNFLLRVRHTVAEYFMLAAGSLAHVLELFAVSDACSQFH